MMDNSQYHPSAALNSSHQFSSLPGISPQQLHHSSALPPQTLPPLQNATLSMQSLYGQNNSAPHTPATPNTPGSTGGSAGYQQPNGAQPMQQRGYQAMRDIQSNPYQQPHQSFNNPSAMMPQTSASMPHPQPIAPAPAQGRLPPPLRPMPSGGLQMNNNMNSPYGQPHMMGQSSLLQEQEQPTHVVGSQGRRGILPSAPGRPAVTATGTGATKNAMIPAKDADGKFPCPHCTKTYLHAKHLKRHLLRHTGDRPYMCVLCRDTFSRSDILKRHFQKCSIRRGNPTGASHLSHAQAHLKKSHPGPHKAHPPAEENLMNNMNGMNGMPADGSMHPFGISPDGRIPDAGSNLTDEQAAQEHLSRSNSLKRLSSGGGRDRRSMTGPGPNGSSRASFDQNYSGEIPSTMSSGINPQLAAYSMPNGNMQNGHNGAPFNPNFDFANQNHGLQPQSNGDIGTMANGRGNMPMFGGSNGAQQHSNLDWSQMFQPGAQDGFMSPFNPNVGQSQIPIKTEQTPMANSNGALFNGIYPSARTGTNGMTGIPGGFPNWNLTSTQQDPLQHIANQVTAFCFPPGSQTNGQNSEIKNTLSTDNIKHFLEQYTNFQGHFPIIHMPTFRITETYEGLLLAMICVGAVYSDKVNSSQVRELMELTKVVLERASRVYAVITRDPNGEINFGNEALGNTKSDLEEIQAAILIQTMFIWNGTPIQRESARRHFPMIVALARRAGLTHPSTSPNSFSVLHQPNVNIEHFSATTFDWNTWVEQEKRSRLLYFIYLTDSAMVLFFNIAPQFENLEIQLPLPADDAAWDASSSAQCAEALGLHGPHAARAKNIEGSRRPKQPEMHSALKALMHNVYDLQPGTTNVYSKFILIHALHVQIWNVQRQLSQDPSVRNQALSGSVTGTPIAQNDWVGKSVDLNRHTPDSSGRATPVENGGQPPLSQQLLKATNNALDKWKRAWDDDMATQYPPSSTHYRRFGFCRDGVHFFWLAKYILKNSHSLDWQLAPDQRFGQIINVLKLVKGWVISDSAKRGEELGSVSDIGKDYGVSDLTLDMAQLFRPINKQIDSPVAGVSTDIGTNMA